jgi:serine/threonine protein kinase
MVHDKKCKTGSYHTPEYVALKIQKSAPHYREAAMDEIELLRCASEKARSPEIREEFGANYDPATVLLIDHFDHTGPHGSHVCMVFEMLGENLLEVIKKYDYKGIPLPIVRSMARQICIGLDFLHRHCNIIHTDLKPENILIAKPPPLPDRETISKIMASGSPQKTKKKKKKGGDAEQGDVNKTIEAIQKQLTDKSINAEQRKKLKKKLKKKKQQAKKKDKKRGSKRNRRSDRPGALDEGASSLSIEKADEAELEMRMMERDYNRLSRADGTAGEEAAYNTTSSSAEINDDFSVADAKSSSSPNEMGTNNRSIDYKRDTTADFKRGSDDGDNDTLEAFSNLSLEDKPTSADSSFPDPPLDVALPQSELLKPEEVMALMPPWLRPTWFSFLNFCGEEYDECSDPPTVTSSNVMNTASLITAAEWISPTDSTYSKITMIVSTNRMLEVFGRPDDIVDDDELPFADWCLAFDNELLCGESESSKHFMIRGHGIDKDDITSLAGLCSLNSLAYESEKYYIHASNIEADQLVVWNIIHHCDKTEAVMRYLESKIDGLKFLVHFDSPVSDVITEEDDAELLYVMRQLIIHPSCDAAEVRDALYNAENRFFINKDSNDGTPVPPETYQFSKGCGCMLGIDVAGLSKSIRCATEDPDLPESERKSYDFTGYVHPLEKRYAFFIGESEAVNTAIPLYNRINQTLIALGEGSDDMQEGGIDDEFREKTSALDIEYHNAHVKIVDLGNACWTNKHFTEDIQTRQYRSPEVLVGCGYDTTADMWSFACVIFELLTGDLLFDPRTGTKWDREEDHLAMMIELCGDFPRNMTTNGKNSQKYFNKRGDLHHIHQLKYWPLYDVLHDKYRLPEQDAEEIASFLMQCLTIDPTERASAYECLAHPWLADEN